MKQHARSREISLRVEDAYAKKGSQCTQFEFKYEDENMVAVIHAFNMTRGNLSVQSPWQPHSCWWVRTCLSQHW